jgi:hypothetical protein
MRLFRKPRDRKFRDFLTKTETRLVTKRHNRQYRETECKT